MAKMIIFDFDGTIADTLHLAVEIYNTVAPEYGCKPVLAEDLARVRGTKPKDLMREYGVSKRQIPFILNSVRALLRERLHQAKPFAGIAATLEALSAKGATLGILSSNSKENVESFLRLNKLDTYFSFVVSSRHLFGKHRALKKIMLLNRVLQNDVTYIGDEVRDIEAGKNAGVTSVAVTWGFQTHAALADVKPDHIFDTPSGLLSLVD